MHTHTHTNTHTHEHTHTTRVLRKNSACHKGPSARHPSSRRCFAYSYCDPSLAPPPIPANHPAELVRQSRASPPVSPTGRIICVALILLCICPWYCYIDVPHTGMLMYISSSSSSSSLFVEELYYIEYLSICLSVYLSIYL